MDYICLIFLLGSTLGVPLKKEWTVQYGTVLNPNQASLKPIVKKGEIFSIDGGLYRAKTGGVFKEMITAFGLPESSIDEHPTWKLIEDGSYMSPKNKAATLVPGDLYRDKDGLLVRATAEGPEIVNEKANWMGLSRNEIGDRRIGDLFIPGTHDSGTVGVDESSYLVDRNALFILAQQFEPMIIANWSKTQDSSLGEQCEAGFRFFDMRIADLEDEDGSFRWWHGLAGFEIQIELQEIANFARDHPEEIILLEFGHFAKPGDQDSPTVSIPERRKDVIAEILLQYLEPYLALESELSSNPTVNEILATGKNIILEMNDAYIRPKHDGFWSSIYISRWVGKTNPEDIFIERASKMQTYLESNRDQFTSVSGCHTPDEVMIIAALLRIYGDNKLVMRILEKVAPEYAGLDPDRMSYEGMWLDLVTSSRYGINTAGMMVRPEKNYTSGASVHYRGLNDMAHYWAARPDKFKVNEIHVDDAVASSTLVQTAIQSAKSEINREVSIAFQGNSKDGYYIWDGQFSTIGGEDGMQCSLPIQVRYRVTSTSYVINEDWTPINNKEEVVFTEGQFPEDAMVMVEVSGRELEGEWLVLYKGNVQEMIESNQDLYLRGANLENREGGFAYTSYNYNVFGNACDEVPTEDYLEILSW
ncbi:hypothetical protein CAPTEDRAFT_217638 [Capitella teleta]|uniref:Phosphatidylinositol-specific phospholipase C X domain-containing protein n=1 Tax=Capitella teleta TaxID=283909 RepID=X2AMH3_CAPTE|nr:hypothetical protein CAPTEDRAFT_217638 [Capitella teleta]|eukprot:ELU00255.1 hypothetical protein CAPTEDRAFT_217638 [Capitella teleta]